MAEGDVSPQFSDPALEDLIELSSMGELSPLQQAKLVSVLQNDRLRRMEFIKAMAFEAMLADELMVGVPQPLSEDTFLDVALEKSRKKWPVGWGFLLASISMAVLLLGGVYWGYSSFFFSVDNVGVLAGSDELAQPIATLSDFSGEGFSRGQRLKVGRFEIESGRAELTFDCGAIVTLTGPASIELLSEFRVLMSLGELSATVPPQAIGFVVLTPTSHIKDLGTAFALRVGSDGNTELHVAEGMVEATSLGQPNANAQKFTSLQSALFSKQAVEPLDYDDQLFVKPKELSDGDVTGEKLIHWSFDQNQKQMSDASGRYSLELKRIRDRGDFPVITDGVSGSGVRFNGKGGYAQSSYPGVAGNQARSVAFWLRLPLMKSEEGRCPIVSWGAPRLAGKWEVGLNRHSEDGQQGAIRVSFGGGFVTGATDLFDGRWHHVAVVFHGGEDANVSTHVKLYLDGRLEMTTGRRQQSIETMTDRMGSMPVVLGRFIDDRSKIMRSYFIGDLDELFVVDRAISQHEVVNLLEVNSLVRVDSKMGVNDSKSPD